MIKDIKIKHTGIGEGWPCFIIAEAGSNHNGDLSIAKKLISAAKEAGADAIKFQVFSAKKHFSQKVSFHSAYKEPLYNLIQKLEIPREWLKTLKDDADKKDIIFFASPCDYEAVDQLEEIGTELHKISSFEIVDLDLIRYVAKKQKTVIISTGLANMEEIEDAYLTCMDVGNKNVILLQCASLYPAPPEIMNLSSMDTMKKAFNVITGISDHTIGNHISVAATAMGAKVIEKHFTLDKNMDGPDHHFAIEPDELKKLVNQVRDVEKAIGSGMKLGPNPEEMEFYEKARRSIHAACLIPKDTIITKDMLINKRPGCGIKPKFVDNVINRKANTNIEEDQWIKWDMIS